MTETVARLEAKELHRCFDHEAGVAGITLAVQPGEIHALVGLNGAGKTTFMRLILGMIRPTAGTSFIEGHAVHRVPDHIWAEVGHMVDGPLAYGELTVQQNLAIAAQLRGMDRTSAAAAAVHIIDELDLGQYQTRRARVLSQGNRQRLGIGAALIHDPLTVILDEPTNSLDPAGVIRVRETLRRRAEQGAGILVSSHHLDELARIAHRITVMNRGLIIGQLHPAGHDLERAFFALIHADEKRAEVGPP